MMKKKLKKKIKKVVVLFELGGENTNCRNTCS